VRSIRAHDILEPLLETRVIILEISSSFASGQFFESGCEGSLITNRLITDHA
jgi:hypothetical protein